TSPASNSATRVGDSGGPATTSTRPSCSRYARSPGSPGRKNTWPAANVSSGMRLLPGDELVEVQNGAGERDPRGGLGGGHAGRLVAAEQLRRLGRVRLGQRMEIVVEIQQPDALLRGRLAAEAVPEHARQLVARCRVFLLRQHPLREGLGRLDEH